MPSHGKYFLERRSHCQNACEPISGDMQHVLCYTVTEQCPTQLLIHHVSWPKILNSSESIWSAKPRSLKCFATENIFISQLHTIWRAETSSVSRETCMLHCFFAVSTCDQNQHKTTKLVPQTTFPSCFLTHTHIYIYSLYVMYIKHENTWDCNNWQILRHKIRRMMIIINPYYFNWGCLENKKAQMKTPQQVPSHLHSAAFSTPVSAETSTVLVLV